MRLTAERAEELSKVVPTGSAIGGRTPARTQIAGAWQSRQRIAALSLDKLNLLICYTLDGINGIQADKATANTAVLNPFKAFSEVIHVWQPLGSAIFPSAGDAGNAMR